ncbi:MAG: right-handed parallel beta-helix repeat-containing protein [bacterium]|nr:right-handed parallel beta-helix repeat-containing protein [bacterium]
MKRSAAVSLTVITLLTLGLLFPVPLQAQGGYVFKTFGASGSDSICSMTGTGDGGYVFTGCTDSFGGGRDLLLAKYDSQGVLLWTKTLGGSGDEVGLSVLCRPLIGDIAVVGYTTSHGQGGKDMLLARFNDAGNLLGASTWGASADDVGCSITQALTGNLMVAGYSEEYGTFNLPSLFIARISLAFDTLQITHIGGELRGFRGYSVVQTSFGFLVAGTVEGSLIGRDVLLAAFEPEVLMPIPGFLIRIGDSDLYETPTSLLKTHDGDYVVTGSAEDEFSGRSLILVKLDSELNVSWGKIMGGGFPYTKQGNQVIETEDGDLVVAGAQFGSATMSRDVLLAKWSGAGVFQWATSFGGEADDHGASMCENPDANLYIAGTTTSYGVGSRDALFATCSSSGTTCLNDLGSSSSYDWTPSQTSFGTVFDGSPQALSSWGVAAVPRAFESTTVCQGLCGDIEGTLTREDSPYIALCDLSVPAGHELTIEPGVQILFVGHYDFNVYGRLNAVGTEQDSILFTHYFANEEAVWGGIRFVNADPASRLEYCRIEYGSAVGGLGDGDGGGVYCSNSNPTIAHCTLRHNSAEHHGGGIALSRSNAVAISYCVIADNTAGEWGGGISWDGSSGTISHCTISGNAAQYGGGIASHSVLPEPHPASHPVASGTIVWDNTGEDPIYVIGRADFTASYCDIEAGWPGTGNISCDPLFANPGENDYHLTWSNYPAQDETRSCCIDAGDPAESSDPDYTRTDVGVYWFPHFDATPGCDYLGRCRDDMYLDFSSPHTFTYAVRDGEYVSLPQFPPAEIVWFVMDMEVVDPPVVYFKGLLVGYDPVSCDTVFTISLPQLGSWRNYSGLAYDPRGAFWFTKLDKDSLCCADASGQLIACYDVGHRGLTGLAFDEDNNHLWCIQDGAPDSLLEYDVNNAPTLLQSMPVPWETPGDQSAAGLDYDETTSMLLALNKNTHTIERIRDLDPASAGGVRLETSCLIQYDRPPSPFGVAGRETVFVAGNPGVPPYPLEKYELGDLPVPPAPPQHVTAYYLPAQGSLRLHFTAPQPGYYAIWMTTERNNDGNPDGGADPDWVLRDTIYVENAGFTSWTDELPTIDHANYVITARDIP